MPCTVTSSNMFIPMAVSMELNLQ